MKITTAAFIVAVMSGAVLAAPIAVHNTGVNSVDVVQSIGAATSFWTLVSEPLGAGSGVNPFRFYHPAYYADNSVSGWVSPVSDGNPAGTGNYVYRLTFDLTGLNPATASIAGTFGTDNDGSIALNGNAPVATTGFASFGAPTSFAFSSGFVAGLNTIALTVNNGGNPTAFRVEFSSATADPLGNGVIPEPGSTALVLGGLALLCVGRLRLTRNR